MFGLTACNGEKKMLEYDETTISIQAMVMYMNVAMDYNDEQMVNFHELNDYDLQGITEYFYSTYGMHIDGATLIKAIDSYRDSVKELGDVTATGDITFDVSEDELIVNYGLDGTLHDGSLEIIYDDNLTITSATTNVEYSFAECMQKAGVNTAIGMGTVFVMLIVIMIIIMILGAVTSGVRNKDQKKESAAAASVDKAIETIVAHEELSDDLELVAVIAAAIAASEGASSTDGFVVRSIKRIR